MVACRLNRAVVILGQSHTCYFGPIALGSASLAQNDRIVFPSVVYPKSGLFLINSTRKWDRLPWGGVVEVGVAVCSEKRYSFVQLILFIFNPPKDFL